MEWARAGVHHHGYLLGVRIMLRCGYGRVAQITDADLRAVPGRVSQGMDALDAVLCAEGILDRTPLRGAQRRLRGQRLTPAELVAGSQIPAQYRAAHQRYLEVYAQRVSDVYATTRHKHNALAHLWRWLDAEHPELRGPREVRRSHLQAFIPYAIAHARTLQRGTRAEPGEDRATAHSWLVDVRCFFADICTWACEDDSPFREWAPPAVPMERHDLVGVGFEKARRRQLKRQTAAILDLEREMPKLRALAARRWTTPSTRSPARPTTRPRPWWRRIVSGTGRCWSCCCSPGCGSRKRAS